MIIYLSIFFLIHFLILAVDDVTTAVDIYSFGVCALEVRRDPQEVVGWPGSFLKYVNLSGVLQMALLEIQGNGESSLVSPEAINSAIQLLEDPLQRVR